MHDQMSLRGLDAAPTLFQPEILHGRPGQLLGYNLFLAIFPKPEDAQRFSLVGAALRTQHGLTGPCLRTDHLHMTLHAVAGYALTIPQQDIDAAKAAAASVVCRPLPIVFDSASSFINHGKPDNNAFVLQCGQRRRRSQAAAGVESGAATVGLHPKPTNTPHMTMLYDPRVVPAHPIEPFCWTGTRFALVLSHQGRTHDEWIAEWQLA